MEMHNGTDRTAFAAQDQTQQNFEAAHGEPPQYQPSQQQYPQSPYYPPTQPPHYPPAQVSQPAPYIHNQQTVVVATGEPREYVEPYMAWSIINCLFCCWILGLIAIIMSSQTRSENYRGNIEGAKSHSRAAFGLNLAGTITGAIIIIGCVIWYVTILV